MKKPKHFITPEKVEHHAEILANRLKNRYKHLARRFRRQNIDVFRLYDRDIPEVRAVVDWYAGNLVVGEYVRLQTGPDWLPHMAKAAGEALDVKQNKIFLKKRQTKVSGARRYQMQIKKGKRIAVNERDLKFWVNLDASLDTGLFSDHRDTRKLFREMAKDKDVLNLYAYTGAFSCAAAAGGARSVTTVDRSATYIQWAKDNFKLNDLVGKNYEFIRSDTEQFLDKMIMARRTFDLVFVDPPSFSQRRGKGSFDINRHHPELLEKVMRVMRPGSIIIFSTNHQRFDPKLRRLPAKKVEEITSQTVPEDYRNKLIHRAWRIEL